MLMLTKLFWFLYKNVPVADRSLAKYFAEAGAAKNGKIYSLKYELLLPFASWVLIETRGSDCYCYSGNGLDIPILFVAINKYNAFLHILQGCKAFIEHKCTSENREYIFTRIQNMK